MFSSADRVVRDVLGSCGDTEAKGYAMCLRQLIRSANDLKLNVFQDIRSVALELSADLSLALPQDCARPMRVGALLGDGSIRLLGRIRDRDTLRLCDECQPGGTACPGQSSASAVANPGVSAAFTFYNFPFDSGMVGELYGFSTDYFENGKWAFNPLDNTVEVFHGYDVVIGNMFVVMYEAASDKDELSLISDEQYETLRCHMLMTLYSAKDPGMSENFRRQMRMHIANAKRRKLRNLSRKDFVGALLNNTNTA